MPPTASGATGVPIPVAVVGAGFIAHFHLEILASTPSVRVIAICDVDVGRAGVLAKRYGVEHAVARPRELGPLGVRVAHVLVPPDRHAAVLEELLEAGVGAFAEKPMVLSSAEALALGRKAKERGLLLGAHHNSLFHPTFRRLADTVRGGRLGRLEHVRVCLSVPLRQLDAGDVSHWMFREPRNIVFEQAPHPFAQVLDLVGPLEEMRAHVLETVELASGVPFHPRWVLSARGARASAEFYFAFGSPFTRWTLEALCTDGSLEADLTHGVLVGERKTQALDFWNSFLAAAGRGAGAIAGGLRGLWNWSAFTLGIGPRRDSFYVGMRDSIRAFYAAVVRGEAPPVGAAEAAEVLRYCEAAVAHLAPAPDPAPSAAQVGGPARSGEIAVLGASGFIGRRVVARLLERGAPVTAVVRRTTGLPPQLGRAGVRLVRASLEDTGGLEEAVRGVRVVVHLATGGGADWAAIERSMVQGSLALLEAAARAGVERFVYVSSTAALYLGADAGPSLPDAAPPDPEPERRALYARGKIRTETLLAARARELGVALVIARPAVVLGAGSPMQHSGLGLWVRDNHCVGWGPGDGPVPVVWVDDVAEALALAALHVGPELDGKAMNLAADTGLSSRRIVREMARSSGRRLVFHPRSLYLSQAMEIGKWVVKKVGRRPGAEFPSWRDLKSRQMAPKLLCDVARGTLGWRPVDDPEAFLDAAVRSQRGPHP